MAQGNRPDRVGEQIRQILSQALGSSVRDPGIGFLTITRVKVSPDLQVARVFYTSFGDDQAKKATRGALGRATPFLRREIGAALRLRRVPELHFQYDESVENQDRIERILLDLQREREQASAQATDEGAAAPAADADQPEGESDPGQIDEDDE